MATEREMVAEMVADLTKARQTLREQLAGLENQLFVLTKLGERMDAAVRERESVPKPEPEPPDPLAAIGLSSGGIAATTETEDEAKIEIEAEDVEEPIRLERGRGITQQEEDTLLEG
ncbi:MAG: hypothetical protein WC551_09335 [Patescibacteria group bacterium]